MGKKMLIDATHAEETRVVVVDGNKVEEFDFESENKRQLAGNIYLAKVTRVEPSLQAAFVDYGGNRHGFLAFSEIHPDYYQIPVADREALMAEERALAAEQQSDDEEENDRPKRSRSRSRRKKSDKPEAAKTDASTEDQATEDKSEAPAEATSSENAVEPVAVEEPAAAVADAPVAEEAPAEAEAAPAEAEASAEPAAEEAPAAETATEEASVEEAPAAEAEDASVEEQAAEETQAEDSAAEEAKDEDGDDRPRPAQAARNDDSDDAVETREISGMETIDLDDAEEGASEETNADDAQTSDDAPKAEEAAKDEGEAKQPSKPKRSPRKSTKKAAVEETEEESDADPKSEIESVAEEDESEDIRPARKPRARRYKIQEVIKVRQIMLVQVVKEERGNKGAALTTYLSLAGRYCVLMPNTARGGGISRKITNAADRKKLKEIAGELAVPLGAGLIIRTAGAQRTKSEIKRDYEYLQRMWEQIRENTLQSVAPCKIYEEGDLIKRSIRDLYNREIDEVLVEGDRGYRNAKDFMKMIMPSHAKNVKHYNERMPLFARYQVESYLSSMFNPTVQLKSGGYIVIGVTEALVAIDVNSGKATKEGSIEETALKTNLEAAEEVARQLRLRDLAGLIVIDFIDMDERKNNTAVEKRMKDKLKTDRARIQVGRISGFGLMEMSRQRLRPGMIEATTQPCPHCHGTGLLRSDDNVALAILRQLEEEGVRGRSKEALVKVPLQIANYLFNHKREHMAMIENRYGMAVRIEVDGNLISPDFSIEKFKTAVRVIGGFVPEAETLDTSIMDALDADSDQPSDEDDTAEEAAEAKAPEQKPEGDDNGKPKKRRRRRRRGGKNKEGDEAKSQDAEGKSENTSDDNAQAVDKPSEAPAADSTSEPAPATEEPAKEEAQPASDAPASEEPAPEAPAEPAEPAVEEQPAAPKAPVDSPIVETTTPVEVPEPVSEQPAPVSEVPEPVQEDTAPSAPEPEIAPEEPSNEPPKPKRTGWWSV
ncbi:Rne/Rng family ribonuclease [Donghicola sp.]|jgi:ribonuclease E|uniref:Rne/Rng family ribonuclease n=1 Tax=Donghicola sp. TaxID=1929294 RepID=UPI0025D89AD8|nr:Rne/Rng family ribonuclease [Donghicola sp.]MCT4575953.1 Rne/Rng family ribonuclease [Donghicola sp.]